MMYHVLNSNIGMVLQRLMRLLNTKDGLIIYVRWRGLPDSEDTVEPIVKIFEDVS